MSMLNFFNFISVGRTTLAFGVMTLGLTACLLEPDIRPKLEEKIALRETKNNFTEFEKQLDKERLKESEIRSLKSMVYLLTNPKVFEKFVKLCSDVSSDRNIEQCINEAKSKIFTMHTLSGSPCAPLFTGK